MNVISKIIIISLGLLCSLLLDSCKSKIDKNIDKLNNMEAKYIEACNDRDFDKARNIVMEMSSLINETTSEAVTKLAQLQAEALVEDGSGEYALTNGEHWNELNAAVKEYESKIKPVDSHLKYVNDKEIYHLLAKPSSEANQRILFLYNQYEKEQLPDMNDVIDVALSSGNEMLPTKLVKSGVVPTKQNIITGINNNADDFIEIAITKDQDFIYDKEILNCYTQNYGDTQLKGMLTKAIQAQLLELQNFDIPQKLPIGKTSLYCAYKDYNKKIEILNQKCYKLIVKAMDVENIELAQKAFSLMKPTYILEGIGRGETRYNLAKESFQDINDAKQIMNK